MIGGVKEVPIVPVGSLSFEMLDSKATIFAFASKNFRDGNRRERDFA